MKARSLILIISFLILARPILAQTSLDSSMSSIAQQYDLMGGVLVTFCNDGELEKVNFGWADIDRNIPVGDSTFFRIASVSKLVTAMAFMLLVDDGLVGLDDDISTILGYNVVNPTYPNTSITPRMLLSHTSSIIDGPTYSNFLSDTYNLNPIPDLSEILVVNGTYYNSMTFNQTQPGTYFNYSNLNYVIIGTLIENISGEPFDQFCRDRLFTPLGIRGSFNVADISDLDHLAVLYRKPNGVWISQADNYQGVPPNWTNLNGYQPGTNGGRFAPQGGFRCRVSEMALLMRLLINNGQINGQTVLSSSSVQLMLGNEWTYDGSNGNNYFGLFNGWGLGVHRIQNTPNGDTVLTGSDEMFGHPGEAYGLVSDAYVDTSRGLGFVFLTNGSGTGYQVGAQSVFYTVEKDVFTIVEDRFITVTCAQLGQAEEQPEAEIRVLPTVFSDTFVVQIEGNVDIDQMTLYDRSGKAVRKVYRSDRMTSLSSLPSGVYLLQIQTKKGDYSTYVVKE